MAIQKHVPDYNFLTLELEKYKEKEGSCGCLEAGRVRLCAETCPHKRVLPVPGLRNGGWYNFWPQSLYQLGIGNRERRKEKLKRSCFCWTPVHFSPVYFKVKATFPPLLSPQSPNSIAMIQGNACVPHSVVYLLLDFHCPSLCLISEKLIPSGLCLRLFLALEVMVTVCSKNK